MTRPPGSHETPRTSNTGHPYDLLYTTWYERTCAPRGGTVRGAAASSSSSSTPSSSWSSWSSWFSSSSWSVDPGGSSDSSFWRVLERSGTTRCPSAATYPPAAAFRLTGSVSFTHRTVIDAFDAAGSRDHRSTSGRAPASKSPAVNARDIGSVPSASKSRRTFDDLRVARLFRGGFSDRLSRRRPASRETGAPPSQRPPARPSAPYPSGTP
mmetsp:Transcript_1438/g.5902  ORF Transcript_1438/g.5902 Transcript_1438/m.5902 type:complete len:211 (-) Transcript_1438:115-747(-)